MPRFLSPAWFEEVNRELQALAPIEGAPGITIGQIVTGGPDGEVRYSAQLTSGRLELVPGDSGAHPVTLVEDHDTALALARGELTAGEALLAGRLRIRGDLGALVAAGGALGLLAETLSRRPRDLAD